MRWMSSCALICALTLMPSSAAAQGRVPAKDSGAVGGEIGVFFPAQDGLGSGLTLEGSYEYYLTPRTSMRIGLGWAEPNFDFEDEDSLRYIRVPFDVVYNWEGGAVHPFAGGGLGIYFLQLKDNGVSLGDSETKVGGTIFGGVEYFTSDTFSVKGELRYHLVSDVAGLNPDGVSLTIGVKKYF
jgi:outer membrane protein with beta-barrel domain